MIGDNHKDITEDALKLEINDRKALDFIKRANVDSDNLFQGGCANNEPQHFCREDKSQSSLVAIDNSKKFLLATLSKAKQFLLLGFVGDEEKNYPIALYFLGRGLHCAQDFYAHSNWILLPGNSHACWNTVTVPNSLKLCIATPKDRQADNLNMNYKPRHLLLVHGRQAKQQALAEMRDPSVAVLHPDMNFDWSYTWGSKVYKTLFPGGDNGYQRARDLAVRETDRIWHRFAESVQSSQFVRDPYSRKRYRAVGRAAWKDFMGFRLPKKVSMSKTRKVFNEQVLHA